jgi:hypothetical protein
LSSLDARRRLNTRRSDGPGPKQIDTIGRAPRLPDALARLGEPWRVTPGAESREDHGCLPNGPAGDLNRDADRSASRGYRDQQRLVRLKRRERWQSSKRSPYRCNRRRADQVPPSVAQRRSRRFRRSKRSSSAKRRSAAPNARRTATPQRRPCHANPQPQIRRPSIIVRSIALNPPESTQTISLSST